MIAAGLLQIAFFFLFCKDFKRPQKFIRNANVTNGLASVLVKLINQVLKVNAVIQGLRYMAITLGHEKSDHEVPEIIFHH